MVICLERGADLHIAQLMPLPLTVSCFSKIQTGLPFWCRLTWVVPDKGPLNGCVCVCVCVDDLVDCSACKGYPVCQKFAKVTRCVKSFGCTCAVTLTSLGVRRSTQPLKSERTDEVLVWSSVWSSAIINTALKGCSPDLQNIIQFIVRFS